MRGQLATILKWAALGVVSVYVMYLGWVALAVVMMKMTGKGDAP